MVPGAVRLGLMDQEMTMVGRRHEMLRSQTETQSPADLVPSPSLVSYVREGRCALFVGAGLSRPAGYPDWHQLMTEIVRQVVMRVRSW